MVDNIGFEKKPKQREFARLNVTYTVMSKRYLRKLVEEKLVDGWDDPRMPTICGLRRRGYTPTSIFDFVKRAGVAKAYSIVDYELLEHCIREELNAKAARKIAILDPIKLVITNYPEDKVEEFEQPLHPEDESFGSRKVPFCREIWIAQRGVLRQREPFPNLCHHRIFVVMLKAVALEVQHLRHHTMKGGGTALKLPSY